MQRSEFTKDAPGRLLRDPAGYWTFVPRPLPPRIDWTNTLVRTVTEAERSLGRLGGLGHRFPDPHRLVRMFLKREAELSSRIENTRATVRTQLLFEHVPEVEQNVPAVREVSNNFEALNFALGQGSDGRITMKLIRQLHQILLRGVRGHDQTPGKFRREQVYIGSRRGIRYARYVPPPPREVPRCMRHIEQYLQVRDELPPLARAAVVHYQFEAVHPFLDGNGRIGRVLLLLMLCRENVLSLPLLNPSAPLERNRREYYDCLLDVTQRGMWSQWIEFFARGVVEEAEDSISRIERLDRLREDYQRRIRTRRGSALLPRLVDELFTRPSLTLRTVVSLLQIKGPSAQKLIDKLLEVRVLTEATGRRRDRVYLAKEIVDIFAAPED